jgi:hypothetical protein
MINGKTIIQRGRFAVSSEMLYSETPGGTHISSSLPYVADMDQFKVSIQKESGEWRLRMNKGVVSYMQNFFDNSGAYDFTAAEVGKVISDFNIYPSGSKTTGASGNESQAVEQDGYVVLEQGYNYFVFVYSITPGWSTGTATDINNPQLVVCKEGDDPNYTFYNWSCGGGYIVPFVQQTVNNVDVALAAGGSQVIPVEHTSVDMVYKQIDCARHNIAHVIWDAAKGWQVRQLQLGPFFLQSHSRPGRSIYYTIVDGLDPGSPWNWDPTVYSPYATSQSAISGYDKNLTSTGQFALQNTAPTGTGYLKPT